ncbi:MAG TPA: hypothetical protein VGK22_06945 [Candidatus Angelobacter sp.]|jgi:hypothetical protein
MRNFPFMEVPLKALRLLLIAVLSSCAPVCAHAQTQLEPMHEIKLPVPSSLGKFGGTISGTAAKEMFSMQVAPDQSLLVFDPNANGEWPLVRVKKWWMQDPVSEVLNIPGWTAADSKYSGEWHVDLQITPDGHYAVAFAQANWDGPLFLRKGYVARKPDTLITIIDLQRWQIAGSTHTAKAENADFRGARVLNDNWMALQGLDTEPSSRQYEHLYDRRNLLISIPELRLGPGCLSKRPGSHLPEPGTPAAVRRSIAETLSRQNDEACADVLKVSGVESIKKLESLIYKGHGLEPTALLLQSLGVEDEAELNGDKNPFPVDVDEKDQREYYDHWNSHNHDMYPVPSPFESASHLWYGLHFWYREGSVHSDLGVFDADGRKLKEKSLPHLLCTGQKERGTCGCHIEDVLETQHVLLAQCQIMHQPGYVRGLLKQWLAVIGPDDLSEIGSVSLPKNSRMIATITIGDGHAYVLVVVQGRLLRVYPVPAGRGGH